MRLGAASTPKVYEFCATEAKYGCEPAILNGHVKQRQMLTLD